MTKWVNICTFFFGFITTLTLLNSCIIPLTPSSSRTLASAQCSASTDSDLSCRWGNRLGKGPTVWSVSWTTVFELWCEGESLALTLGHNCSGRCTCSMAGYNRQTSEDHSFIHGSWSHKVCSWLYVWCKYRSSKVDCLATPSGVLIPKLCGDEMGNVTVFQKAPINQATKPKPVTQWETCHSCWRYIQISWSSLQFPILFREINGRKT